MRAIRHLPPNFTEPRPLATIASSLTLSFQHGLTVAGDAKPVLLYLQQLALFRRDLAACVARTGASPAKFICTEDGRKRVRASMRVGAPCMQPYEHDDMSPHLCIRLAAQR